MLLDCLKNGTNLAPSNGFDCLLSVKGDAEDQSIHNWHSKSKIFLHPLSCAHLVKKTHISHLRIR